MLTLELLKKEQAVATLQQKLGKEVSIPCTLYMYSGTSNKQQTPTVKGTSIDNADKRLRSQIIPYTFFTMYIIIICMVEHVTMSSHNHRNLQRAHGPKSLVYSTCMYIATSM